MFKWFLTGPNKPRIQDQAKIKSMYHSARVQAVTAMILGYGMYYVMRMTLGVAKKPMLEAGFTATQLGAMGAGMLVAIAIGKCANGFIADHCNIKKIVPLGLLGAAIVNAILGLSNAYWVFLVLWIRRRGRDVSRHVDDHHCAWLACRVLCSRRCLHRARLHHVPLHA